MKEVILIRHAKSSWAEPGLSDFDRPLNKRGERDAPRMGKRLKQAGHEPDCIVSSPANRAFTTAQVISDELGYDKSSIIRYEDLYLASVSDWFTLMNWLDDEHNLVIFFGHNPGITEFANILTGAEIMNIPTAGTVHARLNVSAWSEVCEGCGELILFDYPKRIDD